MDDDFSGSDVEDLLAATKKKNKVNGCRKGKTVERELCKILTKRFGVEFNRSVGSGNRWSQVTLTEEAKKFYCGDVCVPETFKWVIESKGGYDKDVDLNTVCDGKGISRLDEFIKQSTHDSEYCGRLPIICWKRARKPWLTMVRQADLAPYNKDDFPYHVNYGDWVILSLTEFLEKTNDKYWFK